MATASTTYSNRKIRSYIVVTAILLVVLAGLMLLLYLFSKPPVNVGAEKVKGYTHVFSIYGFEGDRLYRPVEVAVDGNDNIFVVDSFKHRIVQFDMQGNFIRKFGEKGDGPTQLSFPTAIAVAPDGRIFVASTSQNKVVAYRNYRPYWVINIEKPLALHIKDNKIYTTTARGIMVGDLNGRLISSFGVRGKDKGFVDMPNGISVDDKGTMYVTDSLNYRIQAFSKEGKSLWTMGKGPKSKHEAIKSQERTYGLPTGMTLDENGYLYFVDAFNGEVVIASPKGAQVKKVGAWGHDDGQFYYPGGIAYAGDRTFVVADKFNDRVQVIQIPSPVATAGDQVRQFGIPAAVLLFLALLIAWLLRRRKRVVVADAALIEWAIQSGNIELLKDEFKTIAVSEELYEQYRDRVVGDDEIKLGDVLDVGKYKKDYAEQVMADEGLDLASAKLLAIAVKAKNRGTLLADSKQLRDAAARLNVISLDHNELMALADEEATQPEGAQ